MARGRSKKISQATTAERPAALEPAAKSNLRIDTGKLRSFRGELLCAGIVFLVALVLYSWTLAPTVTLVDSGELIVVARFLGVAHPPGVPLWIMLAHLATLVPWGSIAVRVNFSSALFAALASATLTLVVAEIMTVASNPAAPKRHPPMKKQGRNALPSAIAEEKDGGSGIGRLLVLAPALGSGLLMAFSRTLWFYATITEVYSLNTLLILTIFFLILRWRRCIIADRTCAGYNAAPITGHDRFLYAGALVFGLALGVHHVSVGLMLPALGIIVYRTERLSFFASKRLLYAALFSFAALFAVYAYLPIAAARAPIICWGNPRSLEEVWWHITGRQYQVFFSFSPKEMGGRFLEFGTMALREFGFPWVPLVLVLAITGFASVFKRDRTTFWFLSLMVTANLAYALSYDIAEDKDAYYLPTFIAIAIAAGFGLRWWIELGLSQRVLGTRAYLAAAIPVLLASAVAFTGNWPFNNRRHYFLAHDYVENLFASIEPNGLLLTFDWQVASPMLYAQEVDRQRRDVKVVDVNLLRRSWYFDYLKRAYPDLIERSRDKIDAYVEDLKAWDHNPQLYANDPLLNRRITLLFGEMVRAIVTNENRVAPVYVTSDVPFAEKRDSELTKWLNQNYQLVPQGLVFNLAGDPTFHDLRDVHLETRGLADGTLRFEKDDVASLKVLPVYTSMLLNRGRYLALFNHHERAVAAFKQALALNPDLALARQGLEESTRKLQNP